AGIAAINSLGNLSGFAGPFAMGYLKDLTGGFTAGLLLLAVVGFSEVTMLSKPCAPSETVARGPRVVAA
ncbi:MAG: MFS transporter, partial [Bradyrhizobium sp.]